MGGLSRTLFIIGQFTVLALSGNGLKVLLLSKMFKHEEADEKKGSVAFNKTSKFEFDKDFE